MTQTVKELANSADCILAFAVKKGNEASLLKTPLAYFDDGKGGYVSNAQTAGLKSPISRTPYPKGQALAQADYDVEALAKENKLVSVNCGNCEATTVMLADQYKEMDGINCAQCASTLAWKMEKAEDKEMTTTETDILPDGTGVDNEKTTTEGDILPDGTNKDHEITTTEGDGNPGPEGSPESSKKEDDKGNKAKEKSDGDGDKEGDKPKDGDKKPEGDDKPKGDGDKKPEGDGDKKPEGENKDGDGDKKPDGDSEGDKTKDGDDKSKGDGDDKEKKEGDEEGKKGKETSTVRLADHADSLEISFSYVDENDIAVWAGTKQDLCVGHITKNSPYFEAVMNDRAVANLMQERVNKLGVTAGLAEFVELVELPKAEASHLLDVEFLERKNEEEIAKRTALEVSRWKRSHDVVSASSCCGQYGKYEGLATLYDGLVANVKAAAGLTDEVAKNVVDNTLAGYLAGHQEVVRQAADELASSPDFETRIAVMEENINNAQPELAFHYRNMRPAEGAKDPNAAAETASAETAAGETAETASQPTEETAASRKLVTDLIANPVRVKTTEQAAQRVVAESDTVEITPVTASLFGDKLRNNAGLTLH